MTTKLTFEDGRKAVVDIAPGEIEYPTLDALADEAAQQFFEQDMRIRALGLVLAELVQATTTMTRAEARAEVRRRFRDYYRGLME